MNKEYLNEEEYQKANVKIKRSGLIMLIIGIILIIIGVILINNRIFGFSFVIGIGIPVSIIGALFRFYIPNLRKINAYVVQQQMPVTKESVEKMSPSMGIAAKEITKGVKEGLKDEDK